MIHPLNGRCEIEEFCTRELWLDYRRPVIGASEAYDVVNDPLPVYERKVSGVDNVTPTEQMRWGLILEDPIRAETEKRIGCDVVDDGQYTVCRSLDHPFMSATLDGVIAEPTDELRELFVNFGLAIPTGPGVVEIKTAGPFVARQWRSISEDGEPLWPLRYQVQTQHQLCVTCCTWGIVSALLCGSDHRLIPFEANDAFISSLVEAESEFYRRVQDRDPPPPTGSDASKAAIARIYHEDSGSVVELDEQHAELHERLMEIKSLDKDRRELENKLKAAIGEATYAYLPDGSKYSFKTIDRAGYYVDPTTYRRLYFHGGK